MKDLSKETNIIEIIKTINKGILELKDFFEVEVCEYLPKEAQEDFNYILRQLKMNCKNLDILSIKINKKGSKQNE